MTSFPLKIVTPDGLRYEGQAEEVIVRTTTGDLGFLAGHTNCVAPLGMGRATFILDGVRKYGACIGGMVSVMDGAVTVVATAFEWADKIDVPRAESSAHRAEAILASKDASSTELKLAEARLKRALIRKSVAESK